MYLSRNQMEESGRRRTVPRHIISEGVLWEGCHQIPIDPPCPGPGRIVNMALREPVQITHTTVELIPVLGTRAFVHLFSRADACYSVQTRHIACDDNEDEGNKY